MKRFDMEIQPQPYYMGEGESPLTVSPYESTNGDWVQWDDVQELEESHQRLLDALKEIVEQTDGRNNSVMGQDRAYSIARAAIAKSDLDIHNL